jgi:UDP-N-acetylglucosamine 2-epimerase
VETVESGWNILVGSDYKEIINAFQHSRVPTDTKSLRPYGSGKAAENCVKNLIDINS